METAAGWGLFFKALVFARSGFRVKEGKRNNELGDSGAGSRALALVDPRPSPGIIGRSCC